MIATDGYVLIGKDQVSSTTPYNSFFVFSNGEDHDLFGFTGISGVWGIPETQISYKMEGEAPNRSLVVQYKNLVLLDRSFSNTPADTIQATTAHA